MRLAPRALVPSLALALALAPVAAAQGAETIRGCSKLGCVVVADMDGDGEYDWANVALVPSGLHAAGAQANVNGTVLAWGASAGTEELLPPETFHVVFVGGSLDGATTRTEARLEEMDEESGAWTVLASATLSTADADGDGRPEATLKLVLP